MAVTLGRHCNATAAPAIFLPNSMTKFIHFFPAIIIAAAGLHAQVPALPVIARQPPTRVITTEAESIRLSVEATGTGLSYQWIRNGVPVGGLTGPVMFHSSVSVDYHAGGWVVRVSNAAGSVTSTPTDVVVLSTRVVNVSTRGFVGTGGQAMSVGFVIRGHQKHVLVRAVGPSLAVFGIEGALPNPVVRVFHIENGAPRLLSQNDDWDDVFPLDSYSFLVESSRQVGAFPLQRGSKDAALTLQLSAGNYTVEVEASSATATGESRTGIALVEVYEIE